MLTGLEALQSVQYVTVKRRPFAVISAEDWETLTRWLETLEDVQIAKQAYAKLQASGHDRARAGWLRWDEAKEELL
jgi:hypothetical protein